MKIKLITLSTAVLLTASAGLAQPTTTEETTTTTTTTTTHIWNDPSAWWASHWQVIRANQYTANELSLDMFGSYVANERRIEDLFKTNIRHGTWGGGVGLNYFFTQNFGIGGDINMPANGGKLIDNAYGQLIARIPIACSGIAPYVFGGGGRQIEPSWQWEGHAGVGIEYRLNPGWGIFTDARYTWVKNTSDEILFRGGLRFVF